MIDLTQGLIEANLAAAAAILIVILLRNTVRHRVGAHAAYLMWAIVRIAMLATLIPARVGQTIFIRNMPPVVADPVPAVETAAPATNLPPPVVLPFGPDTANWVDLIARVAPFIWLAGAIVMLVWMV